MLTTIFTQLKTYVRFANFTQVLYYAIEFLKVDRIPKDTMSDICYTCIPTVCFVWNRYIIRVIHQRLVKKQSIYCRQERAFTGFFVSYSWRGGRARCLHWHGEKKDDKKIGNSEDASATGSNDLGSCIDSNVPSLCS